MAIYTGNVNRVTGLSGIDTEGMIDKMMKAESAKYERLQKDQIWVTWRQEAYRDIIKNMQDFQNKWFSSTNPSNNLSFQSAWNNFTTSVKDIAGNDSSAVTIKNAAQAGKYELEIKQVAQTESITGKPVSKGEITSGAKAEDIYKNIEDAGEVSFKFELDGTSKEITIKADDLKGVSSGSNADKVKEIFQKKLDDAFGKTSLNSESKVKAEIVDGKLKFSAKNTSSLTISEGNNNNIKKSATHKGVLAKDLQGDYEIVIKANDGKSYKVTAKFDEKDDTADKKIAKIVKGFKEAEEVVNGNTNGTKVDISKKVSIRFTSSGDDLVIENKASTENYEVVSSKFTKTSGNGNYDTANDVTTAVKLNSVSSLNKLGLAPGKISTAITEDTPLSHALGDKWEKIFGKASDKNGGLANDDGNIILKLGGKDITITKNETIKSLNNKIEAAGSSVKLSFNQVTGRFKLESSQSGADNKINIQDEDSKKFIKNLGIDLDNKETGNDAYVEGQNAKFTIDGIDVERSSNDVDMNGLKFTINGVSNGKITIESKTDEKSTFDKLKEFVDDYNKLIESVEKKINEPREKSGKYGYFEPLLPEEKNAMSEDEIKNWEEKAKTGTLYKDEILTSILSELRNLPYQQVDIGGKTISLADIGIKHSAQYNSGKLEIDEEKLKKAISEKGNDIASLFTTTKTGMGDKIKDIMERSIGSKGRLRNKAGIKDTSSVKNNLLSKELEEIAKRMAEEKERLYQKETHYFNMFAQMEAAMNQQNAQMGMLLGMLGQQ